MQAPTLSRRLWLESQYGLPGSTGLQGPTPLHPLKIHQPDEAKLRILHDLCWPQVHAAALQQEARAGLWASRGVGLPGQLQDLGCPQLACCGVLNRPASKSRQHGDVLYEASGAFGVQKASAWSWLGTRALQVAIPKSKNPFPGVRRATLTSGSLGCPWSIAPKE